MTVFAAVVASIVAGNPAEAIEPGSHAYPVVERFMVEMPDGIRLATDVYYPQDDDAPWPVILYRTPYGIDSDNVAYVADLGYVAVCQDTRGCHDSEGTDNFFRDDGWGPDHTDGLDTVSWIIVQTWCNGRIGSIGSSARGITQNLLAGALPDSVRCLHVGYAPSDFYSQTVFPGGAFREYDVEGWLASQGSSYILDSLDAHPNDDSWWSWLDTETRHPMESIPAYQFAGWYDLFLQGNINSFTGLQSGGGQGAAGNQKLLIGPWAHGGGADGHVGELYFPDADDAMTAEALIGTSEDWFGYWLDGEANGIMELPPVAYYVMGAVDEPGAPGNEWRASDYWPPDALELAFYLTPTAALSTDLPGVFDLPKTFSYDPDDPVPTLGGANLFLPTGPYDQTPTLGRSDVLVYESEPLQAPLEIAGQVLVNVYVSSDRTDTDFTAKLCDLYPDGRAMLICDGVLRARHRYSMETEEFMTPGEIYLMAIDLWETSFVFTEGHQILLAISSSNHPRYDANPNTGDPFHQNDTTLVATNTVYHSRSRPSHLLLRVVGDPPVDIAMGDGSHRLTTGGICALSSPQNPFPPSGTIAYALESRARTRVGIYDVGGRLVRVLRSADVQDPGRHVIRWDARDQSGNRVEAGIYFIRLRAESEQNVRRIVLLP